jgi:hypothetical protein
MFATLPTAPPLAIGEAFSLAEPAEGIEWGGWKGSGL